MIVASSSGFIFPPLLSAQFHKTVKRHNAGLQLTKEARLGSLLQALVWRVDGPI